MLLYKNYIFDILLLIYMSIYISMKIYNFEKGENNPKIHIIKRIICEKL